MIIAGLWRYGDWRHVFMGCNALVDINFHAIPTVTCLYSSPFQAFSAHLATSICFFRHKLTVFNLCSAMGKVTTYYTVSQKRVPPYHGYNFVNSSWIC